MHQEIFNYLDSLNIKYINHTHKKVFTVKEAESVDNAIDTAATKNLFVKDKKKNFFLITLPALKQVNLKETAKLIDAKGGLSFANADYLKQVLNLTPGYVTPFGLFYAKNTPVTFILDQDLVNLKSIGIHPMRNDMTTVIKPTDLMLFLEQTHTKYKTIKL